MTFSTPSTLIRISNWKINSEHAMSPSIISSPKSKKQSYSLKFSPINTRTTKMFDKNALSTYYYVISSYQILLAVFGAIGGLLTLITAFRLRKTTTFFFISFLAITDSLSLYWWNLNDVIFTFFGYHVEESDMFGCKIFNFFQMVPTQASAWLLVSSRFFMMNLWKNFL